jgi:high-affinity Fe2+/Pb2+ permease
MRHQINAVVCAVVLAHAIYWFISGESQTATGLRTSLVVAQAILGLVGAVWFWQRARRPTA